MIKNFKLKKNNVEIFFVNRKSKIYPNIWLRDHIKNTENWDFRTNQRKTFTANLAPDLKAVKGKILENGKLLSITWSDSSSPAKYSHKFLLSYSEKKQLKKNIKPWIGRDIKNQIYIDYNKIDKNKNFLNLLESLHKYGFAVIKNCKPNLKSVNKIANKIGYVRNSIFGGLWTFESDNKKADSAYSQEELRPHTDSTYSNDAPGLQLLLCCKYNAKGGASIMVDGLSIARELKKNHQKLFKTLTEIKVKGKYLGDGVDLEAERPVFRLNNSKEIVQVSFNNYDRAPIDLPYKSTLEFYNAIKKFDQLANSKKYQWRHILRPGELLIFNNWRVMHGRGSFSGKRKMAGCYINKEDFDSCCRMNSIIN